MTHLFLFFGSGHILAQIWYEYTDDSWVMIHFRHTAHRFIEYSKICRHCDSGLGGRFENYAFRKKVTRLGLLIRNHSEIDACCVLKAREINENKLRIHDICLMWYKWHVFFLWSTNSVTIIFCTYIKLLSRFRLLRIQLISMLPVCVLWCISSVTNGRKSHRSLLFITNAWDCHPDVPGFNKWLINKRVNHNFVEDSFRTCIETPILLDSLENCYGPKWPRLKWCALNN